MAVRKETIKRQFAEAQREVLEPGEQVRAAGFTVSGPSPWLMAVFGWLIMLLSGQRYYYMVVTDRRVIFMKASLMSARPKGLAFAEPIRTGAVRDVEIGKLWSHLRYQPAEGKELRLNFHRIWRDEMQAVIAALGAEVAPPPPATA